MYRWLSLIHVSIAFISISVTVRHAPISINPRPSFTLTSCRQFALYTVARTTIAMSGKVAKAHYFMLIIIYQHESFNKTCHLLNFAAYSLRFIVLVWLTIANHLHRSWVLSVSCSMDSSMDNFKLLARYISKFIQIYFRRASRIWQGKVILTNGATRRNIR